MAGVSLGDIAKSLKLSRVTVSMVMNGRASEWHISEATAQRVLDAAKRMGYRKNANASSMTTGKTNLIGYIDMDISMEPSARTLQGLAEAADEDGYFVKLFIYKDFDSFEPVLHRAMEHRPSALMYRMRSHGDLALLRKECLNFGIPLLVHGSAYPMEWGLRVVTDDVNGARRATEHLLSLGHRNIWHLGWPNEGIAFSDSRFKGFLEAMTAAGVEAPESMLLRVKGLDGLGFDSLGELFAGKKRPTALFCDTDYSAMRAMEIARECGFSVPGDISIAGFADLEMAKFASPPLTTVAEPFEDVGRTAFKLLRAEIENPEKSSFKTELCEQLDVKLLIRKSTGRFNNANS